MKGEFPGGVWQPTFLPLQRADALSGKQVGTGTSVNKTCQTIMMILGTKAFRRQP